MKKKPKIMTFDELVDMAAMEIMQELLKGNFRSAVFRMMNRAILWSKESDTRSNPADRTN